LNVVLDVVQKREPHYAASAAVLACVVTGQCQGALPAHAVTTLYYLVVRYQNKKKAGETVSWLLRYFDIAPVGHEELLRAHALQWPDFEDAVVAVSAAAACCDWIVTRNLRDFADSPVPAVTPEEFLRL